VIIHRTKRFRYLYLAGLICLDIVIMVLMFFAAYAFRPILLQFMDRPIKPTNITDYRNVFLYVLIVQVFCFRFAGLYSERSFGRIEDLWPAILKAIMTSLVLLMAFTFWDKSVDYSRIVLMLDGVFLLFGGGLVRSLWFGVEVFLKNKGIVVRRVLVCGPNAQTWDIACEIKENASGVNVVGYCGAEDNNWCGITCLGGLEDLTEVVGREMVDEVIIGDMKENDQAFVSAVADIEGMGVLVTIVPTLQKIWMGNAYLTHMARHPVLKLSSDEFKGWNRVLKDAEDILLSIIGMTIAAPILLFCAIAIKLNSAGPVLFKQNRIGKNGRLFYIYKFRTMRKGAEEELDELVDQNEMDGALFKIKDDPRITKVGRFLRRTSLDELPQLFNVFRGEMSLIGPRPLPDYEITDSIMEWHRIRLKALPGITGLWQVKGRSNLDFEELEKWDVYYVRNWSLWMDFKILFLTIPAVLRGRGAY